MSLGIIAVGTGLIIRETAGVDLAQIDAPTAATGSRGLRLNSSQAAEVAER